MYNANIIGFFIPVLILLENSINFSLILTNYLRLLKTLFNQFNYSFYNNFIISDFDYKH